MLREEDAIRLAHMREAAQDALSFAEGRTRADLDTDKQLRFALVRAIEIVGEAAGQVSEEGRAACPSLPWREIVGMRHRLIHAYWDVNSDRLWETLTENLPPLIAELHRVLRGSAFETEPPA